MFGTNHFLQKITKNALVGLVIIILSYKDLWGFINLNLLSKGKIVGFMLEHCIQYKTHAFWTSYMERTAHTARMN